MKTIIQIIEAIMFLLNLWAEKDKAKAEKKAAMGKEIIDAFAETNPRIRASRLHNIIVRLRN